MLEVALYNGETELVRNTLAFARINDATKAARRITSPFNIGTEGNNQYAWDRGAFPVDGGLDESEVPSRIVVEYEKDGVLYNSSIEVEGVRLPGE